MNAQTGQSVSPAKQAEATAAFVELSQVLTGETELDSKLAGGYHDRLMAAYPSQLEKLLAAFSGMDEEGDRGAWLKEHLDADPDGARVARETIAIWFTSQFTLPDGRPSAGTAEQWKSGLLWKLIDAPAPAAVPGEYGYWAEKPGQYGRGRD
jgi:Membrane bound FAD containing D-sorbitol dehydrogenase